MIGRLKQWLAAEPETRAIGQLRTIANERAGTFIMYQREVDGQHVARIEWVDPAGRICGGESRGTTPQWAARNLLLALRHRGQA